MTYLYGDSTDSGLELNYIELLREFLDFAVQLMLSEHRIEQAQTANDERKRQANAELERLRGLGASVSSALDKARGPDAASRTDQSIVALQQATEDTLRRAAEALKASLTQEQQQQLVSQKRERAANAKLIENLLRDHTLPDSQNTVDVRLNAGGTGYEAEVKGSCPQGLAWRFSADLPAEHRFAELLKVASINPELTIDLPEMSGFVRKSVKLKPHKLSQLYITALVHEGQAVHMKLRSTTTAEDDTGLDIRFARTGPRVSIVRSQRGEESPIYQVPDSDTDSLISLCETLVAEGASLVDYRNKLLEVRFNKLDLRECPDPRLLIERLIDRIGPVIQGIAAHSLADTELVLKRVLANDRREEIFASKADLLDKLSAVPPKLRDIFAPLGLGDLGDEIGDYDPTNRMISSIPAPRASTEAPTEVREGDTDEMAVQEHHGSSDCDIEEDEATNVVGELEQPAHEITAMAADEEIKVPPRVPPLQPPKPPARASAADRISKTIRSPNPPVPPTTNSPAPALDSIDVALAELEADN